MEAWTGDWELMPSANEMLPWEGDWGSYPVRGDPQTQGLAPSMGYFNFDEEPEETPEDQEERMKEEFDAFWKPFKSSTKLSDTLEHAALGYVPPHVAPDIDMPKIRDFLPELYGNQVLYNFSGGMAQQAMQGNKKRMKNKGKKVKVKSKKAQGQRSAFSKETTAPVARTQRFTNPKPIINYGRDGNTCRVQHIERLGTIQGTSAFTTTQFAMNPGLASVFPWLAPIANQFETYKFRRLAILYKPRCATTQTGEVGIAVDYDAADQAPINSVVAEDYQGTVSESPWKDLAYVANPANLGKEKNYYMRNGPLALNLDIKTYDTANVFVFTENNQVALAGYVYVQYDVELMTPQVSPFGFVVPALGGAISTSTGTPANPLGTISNAAAGTIIPALTVDGGGLVHLTAPGTYLVIADYTGNTITGMTPTTSQGSSTISGTKTIINGAATAVLTVFFITTTVANASFYVPATAVSIATAAIIVDQTTLIPFTF
jgi:hypothetical protein